jgi:hypothetical protein
VFTCEQGWCTFVVLSLISKNCWAMLIVAPGNNPDPVGTIARDLGDFTHTFAPRQEPDNL